MSASATDGCVPCAHWASEGRDCGCPPGGSTRSVADAACYTARCERIDHRQLVRWQIVCCALCFHAIAVGGKEDHRSSCRVAPPPPPVGSIVVLWSPRGGKGHRPEPWCNERSRQGARVRLDLAAWSDHLGCCSGRLCLILHRGSAIGVARHR